jgi:hypothetical protein
MLLRQAQFWEFQMTGNSIKTILAFALLVGVASQANANERDHIDHLALKIQRKATILTTEVKNYRRTTRYGQLIGATYQLKGLATHLHTIAHFSGNLRQLRHDVNELDRVFHRVESLFDQVEHEAALGVECIRGNTAHVKALLNAIEDCIHHLQDDIATLSRAQTYRPATIHRTSGYTPYHGGVYGGHGYNRNFGHDRVHGYGGHGHNRQSFHRNNRNRGGVGISIGGGSSRITFRF